MPLRERNTLFHQAERNFRNTVITFENGNRIEIPEIRAMSFEPEGLDDTPIASAGAQEATFSLEGVDLNDMQDVIEEYAAERRREAEYQAFNTAFERIRTGAADSMDAIAQAIRAFSAHSTTFMDALNDVWESLGDDFELADEEEYVVTDPISFDELMGGCSGDN